MSAHVSTCKLRSPLTEEFIWNKPVLDDYTRPVQLSKTESALNR